MAGHDAQKTEGWFVTTQWTVVLSASSSDPPKAQAALEQLCSIYWNPVYLYFQQRGFAEDKARDATQQLFSELIARGSFTHISRTKGRFRHFIQGAVRHFIANQLEFDNALKRGGQVTILPLPEPSEEGDETDILLPADERDPERLFYQNWARTVLEEGLKELRAAYVNADRKTEFTALSKFITDKLTGKDCERVAQKLGWKPKMVPVKVHRLRAEYRNFVRQQVARTVVLNEDIDAEMDFLRRVLSQ